MADLRFSEVKNVLNLKAEDTAQLWWTCVANYGEERKAHQHMQVLCKAVKLRCQEVDKRCHPGQVLRESAKVHRSFDSELGAWMERWEPSQGGTSEEETLTAFAQGHFPPIWWCDTWHQWAPSAFVSFHTHHSLKNPYGRSPEHFPVLGPWGKCWKTTWDLSSGGRKWTRIWVLRKDLQFSVCYKGHEVPCSKCINFLQKPPSGKRQPGMRQGRTSERTQEALVMTNHLHETPQMNF